MIDYQECDRCGDEVCALSTRGWCDGCEDEVEDLDQCLECGCYIARDDVHAEFSMCGSCLHDALRSGWPPPED